MRDVQVADYSFCGGPVIEFDAAAPCAVCGLPVEAASMGGTAICPACDCGAYRGGPKWTYRDAVLARGDTPERKAEFQRLARSHWETSLSKLRAAWESVAAAMGLNQADEAQAWYLRGGDYPWERRGVRGSGDGTP